MFSHDKIKTVPPSKGWCYWQRKNRKEISSWRNVSKNDSKTQIVSALSFFFFFGMDPPSLFHNCRSFVKYTEKVPHKLLNGDESSAWVQRVGNRQLKPLGHPDAHSIDVIDFPSAGKPQCPVGGREFVTLLWRMAGGIILNGHMDQCTHKHTLKWPNWD